MAILDSHEYPRVPGNVALPTAELTDTERQIAQGFADTIQEFLDIHGTRRTGHAPQYMDDTPATSDSDTSLELVGGGMRQVQTNEVGKYAKAMHITATTPGGTVEQQFRLMWCEAMPGGGWDRRQDGRVYLCDEMTAEPVTVPLEDPEAINDLRRLLGLPPLGSSED